MKKVLPYILVTFIFSLVLSLSLPSYTYVNTHDEDDNIVSGYLMSRKNLILSKDIFSHHLPGAYLISKGIDRVFQPQSSDQSVFLHRTFVTVWNYLGAIMLVAIWGAPALWLVVVVELLRAIFLYSLFHAENLVIYPMIYLILTLFQKKKIIPAVSGLIGGMVTVLLSPLWPLVAISALQFSYVYRKNLKKIFIWSLCFVFPIFITFCQIDIKEFFIQFFGYNTLTYAPLLMKKPLLFTLAAFLAPGMVMFDFSFATKIIIIQILILFIFLINNKRINWKEWFLFGLLLGIIGFRSTPRFRNPGLDFHVLPWVVTLATFCWYKFFKGKTRTNFWWVVVLLLPVIFILKSPSDFFPSKDQIGPMVIRYSDDNPVVSYLRDEHKTGETLFTLPAHTLLYRQTGITPFNKFLFYLPWMEQSPILYSELTNSFQNKLPSYIFIDTIHFPYSPPKEIKELLSHYTKVVIDKNEPPIYILKRGL